MIGHRVTETQGKKGNRKQKGEKRKAGGVDIGLGVSNLKVHISKYKAEPGTTYWAEAVGDIGATKRLMKLEPNATNGCFGCGGANERGMRLTFEQDDKARKIRGAFRIGLEYAGGAGFVHGGIIATLLDEAMGKVNRFRGVRAVTAELNVEYLRPVPVDADVVVEAHEVEMKGRNLYHVGEIRNVKGDVLARGRGRFVSVRA